METEINEETLYLLGALRDGNLDVRKGKNYEIKIGQKDPNWLLLVKNLLDKNFGATANINNGLVRVTQKKVVERIAEFSGIKSPQEFWDTPKILASLRSTELIPYIRGFWDAEGGLPKNPEMTKRAEQRYVSFHQKNKESLNFIRQKLIELGFNPTKITFCSEVFEFRICRHLEIKQFYEMIGSWHSEKSLRLKKLALLPPNWRGITQGV